MVSKLTRKQASEALDTLPVSHLLGKSTAKALTSKQREFAREVAKGSTKASAYRKAYKPDATPRTMAGEPYRVASDPRVAREIEAYQMAIEAAKHRSPAALRELVIQSLVQVVIDPDSKASVRVAAAKVLGTVTEVAAFTERKEVRTITSSEDARERVMGELRQLIAAGAEDATLVESQADALLAELSGNNASVDSGNNASRGNNASEGDGGNVSSEVETHPPGTPLDGVRESRLAIHTIPPEASHSQTDWEDPPIGASLEK